MLRQCLQAAEWADICNEIKKFTNLLARYARKNYFSGDQEKITRTQSLFIGYIYNHTKKGEKVYQKDIEKHFSIRRSTATECLKKLEATGHIIRKSSSLDGRLKEITLTKKALLNMKKVDNSIKDVGKIVSQGISKEEFEVFKNVIVKMKNNLNQEL